MFVVKYKIGEDVNLAEHFNNAEVTLNVSTSNDHKGMSLNVYYNYASFLWGWGANPVWHNCPKSIDWCNKLEYRQGNCYEA